jgi:hypothetical protein
VDTLTLEIAIAHHLGSAENLCIELECPVHALDGDTEVLHSLESAAERSIVTIASGPP